MSGPSGYTSEAAVGVLTRENVREAMRLIPNLRQTNWSIRYNQMDESAWGPIYDLNGLCFGLPCRHYQSIRLGPATSGGDHPVYRFVDLRHLFRAADLGAR